MERNNKIFLWVIPMMLLLSIFRSEGQPAPRIVNVINFIRQTEPRSEEITDEVLYETVVEEVRLLNKYNIKGTYLLQYDALINPQYQNLMKNEILPGSEIGGWWEITQPHVEAAGLKWRGRYSWDWHANVGFATGYTPEEREKLVDVYIEKFMQVFGKYPASVGSWFIDAHTLAYMYDKYHIIASCNCKDQIGTDGYTMWGGYWGQAYYPSRINAYMPAQTKERQIQVPIFRMLGSDPIYQYDCGIGGSVQSVVSLEPVYEEGGGSEKWIKWFFRSMFDDPCLTFSYVQTGQENSFTWNKIRDGLEKQIPMLSELQNEKKIRIETLSESGAWFRNSFEVTPPTAISALTDNKDNDRKTVWFNSRFYRANLLWEGSAFRIRDIHLFNEAYKSDYLDKPGTTTSCFYTTLPFVDGNIWSSDKFNAGLRLKFVNESGREEEVYGGVPKIIAKGERLEVEWPLSNIAKSVVMTFDESKFNLELKPAGKNLKWFLEMDVASETKNLPFASIENSCIKAEQNGFSYQILCNMGHFVDCRNNFSQTVFKIKPFKNRICLVFE